MCEEERATAAATSSASPAPAPPPAAAAAPGAAAQLSIPRLMLAGGVSGFTSRFVTHPFDTIKTQMQVQGAVGRSATVMDAATTAAARTNPLGSGGGGGGGATRTSGYRGVLDGAGKILAREGPAGFYRGFGAVVTAVPFASAAYFGGYESAKMLVPESVLGPTASYVVSGMVAQMFAGIVYTPMDVVKERLQVRGGARDDATHTRQCGVTFFPFFSTLNLSDSLTPPRRHYSCVRMTGAYR